MKEIKNTDIICQCSNITVEDVKKLVRCYGDIPLYVVKESLRVGYGCGTCTRMNNPISETSLEEAYNSCF